MPVRLPRSWHSARTVIILQQLLWAAHFLPLLLPFPPRWSPGYTLPLLSDLHSLLPNPLPSPPNWVGSHLPIKLCLSCTPGKLVCMEHLHMCAYCIISIGPN